MDSRKQMRRGGNCRVSPRQPVRKGSVSDIFRHGLRAAHRNPSRGSRRTRHRASHGRVALVATEYADLRTVATAPRRRASRGRGERPLDRKRHRNNGRAGARPSRCPFVADAMDCVPPSAMRDGEGAIATIPARECKTTNYHLPTINYQLPTILKPKT